jgi:hypothetical protein
MPVPEPQADAAARSCTRCKASRPRWSTGCAAATELAPDSRHCESAWARCSRACTWRGTTSRAPAQPARPGLVERDGAGGRCPSSPTQRTLIESELAFQQQLGASAAYAALPRGPIHADLFRDNVMFEGHGDSSPASSTSTSPASTPAVRHRGVPERLVHRPRKRPPRRRARRGLRGRLRRGAPARRSSERRLLPALMRAAALRFWISRLWDLHLPRDASRAQAARPGPLRTRADTPGQRTLAPGFHLSDSQVHRPFMKLQLVPASRGALWVRQGFRVFFRPARRAVQQCRHGRAAGAARGSAARAVAGGGRHQPHRRRSCARSTPSAS